MIAKFDSFNRYETPPIMLCGANSVFKDGLITSSIGYLTDISDTELVLNFGATSELNLRAYPISRGSTGDDSVMQDIYNKLQNRRLLFVEDVGYFVITNVDEQVSREGAYKDITAVSCEIEFENRKVPFIGKTQIVNDAVSVDYTYKFTELLDLLIGSVPKWTYDIGDIDSVVTSKYRTFEDISSDENILAFMQNEMQEAYECIFEFDIINRRVLVYDQNNLVAETNIHLTTDDLIKELKIAENSEDIYTSISVFGDTDNISINGINPLGTNVIYNFDYYLPWMSSALRERLIEWEAGLAEAEAYIREHYSDYVELKQRSLNTQYEIDRLEELIALYKKAESNISVALQTAPAGVDGGTDDDVNAAKTAKATEIINEYNKEIRRIFGENADTSTYEIDSSVLSVEDTSIGIPMAKAVEDLEAARDELTGILSELAVYDGDETTTGIFKQYANTYNLHHFLGEDLYVELSNYIYEGTYSDQYITVTDKMTQAEIYEQCFTLYDRAKKQLERIATPTQKFDIDTESFLFAKEFLPWSKQLNTGACINVELSENKVVALFLTTITTNFYDKTLTLTFGNQLKRNDPKAVYEDVLGNVRRTANTLSYLRDVVSPIKAGAIDNLASELQHSRDLTMRTALSSTDQSFAMDNYGITGASLTDEGSLGPYQIKITNESIVFTQDAWKTCSTALGRFFFDDGSGRESIYGVNAQAVVAGKIYGSEMVGGTITGTTITGGEIKTASGDAWLKDGVICGSTIWGSAIYATNTDPLTMSEDQLANAAYMRCNGDNYGVIHGFAISGGSININNNFMVDANGNCTLRGNITWGSAAKSSFDRDMVLNALRTEASDGDGIYVVYDENGAPFIAVNASLIKAGELNVDAIILYSSLGRGRLMGMQGSDGVNQFAGIALAGGIDGEPTHYVVATEGGVRMQAQSARVVATTDSAYLRNDSDGYAVWATRGQAYLISGVKKDANGNDITPAKIYVSDRSCGSTVAMSTGSDRRLKSNISYSYDKYRNFFMSLKPAVYNFVSEGTNTLHTGFIAQDVEDALISHGLTAADFGGLLPPTVQSEGNFDATNYNPDETYRLGYSEFTSLNTFMIQELYRKIAALESRLSYLST